MNEKTKATIEQVRAKIRDASGQVGNPHSVDDLIKAVDLLAELVEGLAGIVSELIDKGVDQARISERLLSMIEKLAKR